MWSCTPTTQRFHAVCLIKHKDNNLMFMLLLTELKPLNIHADMHAFTLYSGVQKVCGCLCLTCLMRYLI